MTYLARLIALEASNPLALAKTPMMLTDKTDERGVSRASVSFGSAVPQCFPAIGTGEVAEWQASLGLLREAPPPPELSELRWRELVADATRLADEWGERAQALGWNVLDLFGCSPGFARRLDRDGLAMLLRGRAVVALDSASATIANPSGPPGVFRRSNQCGGVPIWQAMKDAK